jgi:primase-polymerase (primpol)-like protein
MIRDILKKHQSVAPLCRSDLIEQDVRKLHEDVLREIDGASPYYGWVLSRVSNSCNDLRCRIDWLNECRMSTVQQENLPRELKQFDNWVLYTTEPRNKKRVKALYSADGSEAMANRPSTWASFKKYARILNRGFCDGLGFILTNDSGVIGLHFDDCIDPATGKITDLRVARWVDRFDSYTELSDRGYGLNVLIKGVLRGKRRRAPNIRLFGPGRVFFVTGKRIKNSATNIRQRQEVLNDFYNEIFERQEVPNDFVTEFFG